MRSNDASPPYETSEIGTPSDYTSDLYRFYFELSEHEDAAKSIFFDFLGPDRSGTLTALPHGYEIDLPIQCVPDILQRLIEKNIAVYQVVVRYAKLKGEWDR